MQTMQPKIVISPAWVWEFFQLNKERLKCDQAMIASNDDTGYSVYITTISDHAKFLVYKEPEPAPVDEMEADGSFGAEALAKYLYQKYLFPVTVVDADAIPDDEGFDVDKAVEEAEEELQEEAIRKREQELSDAWYDFLDVVFEGDYKKIDALPVDQLMDETIDSIATENGEIFRPMYILYEDTGDEVYTEYPYEDLPEDGYALYELPDIDEEEDEMTD